MAIGNTRKGLGALSHDARRETRTETIAAVGLLKAVTPVVAAHAARGGSPDDVARDVAVVADQAALALRACGADAAAVQSAPWMTRVALQAVAEVQGAAISATGAPVVAATVESMVGAAVQALDGLGDGAKPWVGVPQRLSLGMSALGATAVLLPAIAEFSFFRPVEERLSEVTTAVCEIVEALREGVVDGDLQGDVDVMLRQSLTGAVAQAMAQVWRQRAGAEIRAMKAMSPDDRKAHLRDAGGKEAWAEARVAEIRDEAIRLAGVMIGCTPLAPALSADPVVETAEDLDHEVPTP